MLAVCMIPFLSQKTLPTRMAFKRDTSLTVTSEESTVPYSQLIEVTEETWSQILNIRGVHIGVEFFRNQSEPAPSQPSRAVLCYRSCLYLH